MENFNQLTRVEQIEYLEYLGVLGNSDVRKDNVGKSNYSKKALSAWSIWLDYPELTSIDHDIIKRVLRQKEEEGMTALESRKLDYQKIIHDCQERIRQLDYLIEKEKK